MKTNHVQSRRNFIGLLATGAVTTGLAMMPNALQASLIDIEKDEDKLLDSEGPEKLDNELKKIGSMAHPVCYDVSQANHWGFIWSNVYYMTNEQTGTPNDKIGMINVLRHHGMLFALNDDVIAKYKLGEFFGFNDPVTKAPTLRNPFYLAEDGVFPLPGLGGIKKLQELGATFCVCDMARQVNALFVAKKAGLNKDDVYADFVAGTLPGIMPAPSGVWVLGRLAEHNIAYIDASVG